MNNVRRSRFPGVTKRSKTVAFAAATVLALGALLTVPAVASAQTGTAAPEATAVAGPAAGESLAPSPDPAETLPAPDAPVEAAEPVEPAEPAEPAPSAEAVEEPLVEAAPVEAPAPDEAVVTLAGPTTTDVVVSARIAYQRAPVSDTNNPAYLGGVTFELYTIVGAAPGAKTGYTCQIPVGALDCTISIPDTAPGGENAGDRFAVVMTSAGSNATPITQLITGASSEPDTLRYYPGATAPAVGGASQAFPSQGTGQLTNSLVTAAALDNPSFVPSCAVEDRLSLATQMDLSGSVTPAQRAQYRDAFRGLVQTLAGEPVDVSLATFGTSSPVDGRAGGPWALDSEAGVTGALAAIDAYTAPVVGPQWTNWDLALRRVADAPQTYDALLVLTDGAPNYISNDAGTGGQPVAGEAVTLASIEQAVFSANAVKAKGTRVIAMGIGDGVSGPVARNLAAISGPTSGSDYYQGGWETLSQDLQRAVSPLVCIAPVTATTFVTDAAGQSPVATDGFRVSAAVANVSDGTAVINGDNPQITGSGGNGTGEGTWSVSYSQVDATATLTVTQAPQDGLELFASAYTVRHADGTTTTGTGDGSPVVVAGLTPSDRVEVSFSNKPPVTPPTPTPTPTPTPSPTSPVVPIPTPTPSSTSSAGPVRPGTLPTTGAEFNAAPLVAGGLVFLVGAAALIVARRRPNRDRS